MNDRSETEIVEEEVRIRRERKEERMSEKRGGMMESRQEGGRNEEVEKGDKKWGRKLREVERYRKEVGGDGKRTDEEM